MEALLSVWQHRKFLKDLGTERKSSAISAKASSTKNLFLQCQICYQHSSVCVLKGVRFNEHVYCSHQIDREGTHQNSCPSTHKKLTARRALIYIAQAPTHGAGQSARTRRQGVHVVSVPIIFHALNALLAPFCREIKLCDIPPL